MNKKAIIPLAAVGIAAAVPAFVKPPKPETPSENGGGWMSGIDGKTLISQIAIPGSHDSASEKTYCAAIARCQYLTITEQLYSGCRFLDLRLAVKGQKLVAVHGIASCYTASGFKLGNYTLDNIFDELYAFLKENPTETVLVSIKMDRGNDEKSFADIFYNNYMLLSRRFWYTENRVPALGEVRGKAVLIRRFEVPSGVGDSDAGLNMSPSLWCGMGGKKASGYKKFIMKNIEDDGDAGKVCMQDCYGLGVYQKWRKAVKPLLERGRHGSEILISFLSTTGRLSPAAAVPINKIFVSSERESLKKGGIYSFDFFDAKLAQAVYEKNTERRIKPSVQINNTQFTKTKTPFIARYLSGYSNLIYRLFR